MVSKEYKDSLGIIVNGILVYIGLVLKLILYNHSESLS